MSLVSKDNFLSKQRRLVFNKERAYILQLRCGKGSLGLPLVIVYISAYITKSFPCLKPDAGMNSVFFHSATGIKSSPTPEFSVKSVQWVLQYDTKQNFIFY